MPYKDKEVSKQNKKEYYEKNKEKVKEYQEKYREENKERIREQRKKYREKNKERIREQRKRHREKDEDAFIEHNRLYKKKYAEEHKEKIREYQKEYQEKNKEKLRIGARERQRKYRHKNKDKIKERRSLPENKERRNKERRERNKVDDQYNMAGRIRTRFKTSMAQYSKTGKIKDIKEYEIDIKAIVESLGEKPGDDYHIDHIFPVSAFDMNDSNHIKLCWHPDNLQWLGASDNYSKNAKYNKKEFEEYINGDKGK